MADKVVKPKSKAKCPDCSKLVGDKDSGVKCEVCDEWFHSKCQNVPDDTYQFMMDNKSMHWYCVTCNKSVGKILKVLSKLEARQDKVEEEIAKLNSELASIKGEVKEVKEMAEKAETRLDVAIEAKLIAEKIDSSFDSRVEVKVKNIKEDVAESMEIEKRKENLIFFGVKETVSDQQVNDEKHPDWFMIEEILKVGLKLDANRHVADVTRIGRYVAGKVRPVRVKVTSFESRSEILKRARTLKDCEEFKRIFVAPDLTQKQRKIDKDLRDHVKQFRAEGEKDARISSGKVVKNGEGTQVIILYEPPLTTSQ